MVPVKKGCEANMATGKFNNEIQDYISENETLNVLVVDDSKTIRRAIEERLRLGGLKVQQACDGKEALVCVYDQCPDIVLLDVVMPGMDGWQVLKILRSNYSKLQLPIILVTSRDTTTELVRALDMGANDYVTKPIDFEILWARLSNQLMQKKAAEYLSTARAELENQVKTRTQELHASHESLKQEMAEKLVVEDKLKRQANFDELTSLPNRSLAKDRLSQVLSKAKREKLCPSVVFIDLDNFKYVNDTLGHAAGDDLLKEAATRLLTCTRESDTVARLGGDEFLLILDDINNSSDNPRELDLKLVGERIINEFSKSFFLEGQELNISPSIGFAVFPKDGENDEVLMRNADTAMYRSKNEGKNTFCFYSAEMTEKAKSRIQIEAQLRHALERDELSIVYQPIVEAISGRIVKAEVLLRWTSKELGMITPDVFIPVAEETGVIVEIGAWVIKQACQQLKKWQDEGESNMSVTVNVSARQFQHDSNLIEIIEQALAENDLRSQSLQLELTEGILMHENQHTKSIMKSLGEMDIKLLIDDFGTGYASLSYLQKYNFDTLKIDYGYIKNILTSEHDAKLVTAIIAMANSLGLNVVSEGVETKAQLDFILNANGKYVQGYYFSPPVAADVFEDLLDNHNQVTAAIKDGVSLRKVKG